MDFGEALKQVIAVRTGRQFRAQTSTAPRSNPEYPGRTDRSRSPRTTGKTAISQRRGEGPFKDLDRATGEQCDTQPRHVPGLHILDETYSTKEDEGDSPSVKRGRRDGRADANCSIRFGLFHRTNDVGHLEAEMIQRSSLLKAWRAGDWPGKGSMSSRVVPSPSPARNCTLTCWIGSVTTSDTGESAKYLQ